MRLTKLNLTGIPRNKRIKIKTSEVETKFNKNYALSWIFICSPHELSNLRKSRKWKEEKYSECRCINLVAEVTKSKEDGIILNIGLSNLRVSDLIYRIMKLSFYKVKAGNKIKSIESRTYSQLGVNSIKGLKINCWKFSELWIYFILSKYHKFCSDWNCWGVYKNFIKEERCILNFNDTSSINKQLYY